MVHLSITETQLGKLQTGSAILRGQPKKSDVLFRWFISIVYAITSITNDTCRR